jgi:hypothetical protein
MRNLVIATLAIATIGLVTDEAWARRYSLSHDQVAHVCSPMSAGAPGYSSSTDCIKCTGSNCRNYYCKKQTGKCYELILRPGTGGSKVAGGTHMPSGGTSGGPKGHSNANVNVGGVSTGITKPPHGGGGAANTSVGNANQKREYPYLGGGGHHGGGGGH